MAAAAAYTMNPSFLFKIKSSHNFPSNPILSMSNSFKKKRLSITSRNSDLQNKDVPFAERISSWMQDSMVDIVKNLNQAPLLVHIYNDDRKVRLKTEKAILEKWPLLKGEWANGESKSPDGLIFVEELESDQNGGKNEKMMNQELLEEGVTRAWGVMVQGKGVKCGPACYLLKTSRIGCEMGFCTHFCLVRINNFRDSALEQFKDSWLLQ